MPLPVDYIPNGACVPFAQSVDQTVVDLYNDVKADIKPFTDALGDSCNILSAVDNLLQAGARQVKEALKAIGNAVGAILNTMLDMFNSSILDTLIGAVGAIIGGILSAVKTVMSAVVNAIEAITDMVIAAVQGVKNIICDIVDGTIGKIPAPTVSNDPVLSSVKGIVSPAKGNVAFTDKDRMSKQATNDILNKSGYPAKANEILGLEKSIFKEVDALNAVINNACGGQKINPINKAGIIPKKTPADVVDNNIQFTMMYSTDFINDNLEFFVMGPNDSTKYKYDWKFKFNKQSALVTTTKDSDPVSFKYSYITADKLPLEVEVKASANGKYKTIKHKLEHI